MNRIIAVIFCLLALSACEEKKAESPQQKMLERANMTDKEKRAADIEHLSRRSRVADRLGEKQANESQVFDKLGIKQ